MIFALKLTLVLHSGLQSVVVFIFHMFCAHTDLFALSGSLCLSACEIIYSLLFFAHVRLSRITSSSTLRMRVNVKHMQLHTL